MIHTEDDFSGIEWGGFVGYAFRAPVLRPSKFRTSPTNRRDRRKGIRCNRSLSVGSDIQPSIGIAFSAISLCHLSSASLAWSRNLGRTKAENGGKRQGNVKDKGNVTDKGEGESNEETGRREGDLHARHN